MKRQSSNAVPLCRLWLLAGLAGPTTLSCIGPLTEVWVIVETNIPVSLSASMAGLEKIQLNVSVGASELPESSYLLTSGRYALPGHFVLRPSAANESRPVTLTVTGVFRDMSMPAVRQRAVFTFARGRSQRLRMYLSADCVGQLQLRCESQGMTCTEGGQCIPVERAELPNYYPDAGSGVDASGPAEGVFPQPVAPLSLGDVSLLRPTLRWKIPAGTDGALVELCRDRACTQVIEQTAVRGTSMQPALALPARSVVFWRLRSMTGAVAGVTYSPTWLFHVPAVDNSGGVDSSANPHLDLNGDGFDDLAIGAPYADPSGRMNAGTTSVYYGSMNGVAMAPSRVLEGPSADHLFGVSVSGAGDVNGDGFGDLVIGAFHASPGGRMGAGAASVYHGSAMGISAAPAQVLEGTLAGDGFGFSVSGAGDVNGDGYADLVVGAFNATPAAGLGAGTASVYHGTASGIPMLPTVVLSGTAPGDRFGWSVAGAGDVNGDGFSELLVGAIGATPAGRMGAGTASVFQGSGSGVAMVPERVLEGPLANGGFGGAVAGAGDVNGDGYGDLLVGGDQASPAARANAGIANLYYGNAMGVTQAPARVLEGSAAGDQFGGSVASARDVNGDGFAEVVVGAYQASPSGRVNAGTANVFYGSISGIPMIPSRIMEGVTAGGQFGNSAAGVGDLNGDGFGDLAVGAWRSSPSGRMGAGTTAVFHGSMTGVPMVPVLVLEGAAVGDNFGGSVATLDPSMQRPVHRTTQWLSVRSSARYSERSWMVYRQ